MTVAELEALVATQPFWWHRIDLGQGVITPGQYEQGPLLEALRLPDDLTGKSVLDVGTWDGYFAFACERRGARVVAVDRFVWDIHSSRGFDIAHQALGSTVEKRVLPLEQLTPHQIGGLFDIVLFLGVLYHARDMMRYLRHVWSVVAPGGMAVLETHTDANDYPRPAAVFYPGKALNNDPTNYWGPNRACVEAMLLEIGFTRVEYVATWQEGRAYPGGGQACRMIFHAFA